MKLLDKNKKYDLSQLNDEQLQAVLDWLKENDKGWDTCHIDHLKGDFHILSNDYGEWKLQTSKGNETNAFELFNADDNSVYDDILSLIEKGKQQGLKIVVTFEKL